MTAVIYARYSSDNQTEMSIEAQVRACTEYAAKKNISIINIYKDEAMTGRNNNRPGYQEMLAAAFDGKFDVILCHKYDRIARDLEEQASLDKKLEKLGIRLIAVAQDYGEGKDAKLSKGIQWVLGEYYSANLSEEVKKGMREVALKGEFTGGVAPFGYKIINQKYEIVEEEAYWVRQMFDACIAGTGYKNIITELAAIGMTGHRGKPIKYPQIYEILKNEKYAGTYAYSMTEEKDRALRRTKPNAIRIENCFPKIITREIFENANRVLSENTHAPVRKHRCSGLVYCGECGAKMHLLRTKRKGHEYNNFVCSNHCGMGVVSVDFVDEAVDAYLNELFSEKNIREVEIALEQLRSDNRSRIKSFEEMRKQSIAKKQSELQNLLNALASGAFAENYDVCNERLCRTRKELQELEGMQPPTIPDDKVKLWISNIKESNYAPSAFIERMEIKKTEVNIISTFNSVVSNLGCGEPLAILPTTLAGEKYNKIG